MCIYTYSLYTYAYTCVDACAHDVYTHHTRQACPVYMQVCKDVCVPLLKVCIMEMSVQLHTNVPVHAHSYSPSPSAWASQLSQEPVQETKKGHTYSIGFHRLSKQVSLHSLNHVK